jgi:Icc-related predicted phosphoesterase
MDVIAKHEDFIVGVIGDIHGDFDLLKDRVKNYELSNTILFQVGDFGVGFRYNDPREPKKENKRLKDLNDFLKKRNIFLYVIRGNHDNPMFFDGNHNLANLIFMKDYDVVEVGRFTYIGIGGATSVDRKSNHHFKSYRGNNHPGRREGIDWWGVGEKVSYNEDKLEKIAGIDVVLTHTCPDFIFPPILGGPVWKWCDCDSTLKDELIEERAIMSKIYNKLNELSVIKLWAYGHFHGSNFETYGNTKFKLLDVGEFLEINLRRNE